VVALVGILFTLSLIFQSQGQLGNAAAEGATNTSISFKLELKPNSNSFARDLGYYEVAKSIYGLANSSDLCSSTFECKFEVTDGKMDAGDLTGFHEYTFLGRLKTTAPIDDEASRSKFYDMQADLKLFKEKTNGSKTIQFLQGDFNLEPTASDYQITKASLFFENERKLTLTVEAEGTPSGKSIDKSDEIDSDAGPTFMHKIH
jgi:hypothetical protein